MAGTRGAELLAEILLNVKLAIDFLDGDAPVITAVVRVDEHMVLCIALVLQQKLLVGPVHVNLHSVLSADFDAGELRTAVPVPDLHRQPVLRGIDNHSGNLGVHDLRA